MTRNGLSSFFCAAMLALTLSGCAQKSRSAMASPAARAEVASAPGLASDMNSMASCEQELKALATIDPGAHRQLSERFSKVMRGAVDYSDVRKAVNPETQDAIDALYKYQAVKLCAEIRASVLNGLSVKPVSGQ